MKTTVTLIVTALVIAVLLAIGGGLLALLAFGVGWVINLVMHLEPFQATVIGLAGMFIFGTLIKHTWDSVMATARNLDEFDEYDEDYEDEDDEENDEDDELLFHPGVPRWRQPLKSVDFSGAKPDDRCPCGSGRKYKNCHGVKRAK
ncbi:MAG: SEC-C domain-containing protein, partial [Chloroflexi bacterium]|nr:SEC-C domain-containing protein [Chloroflexota bacterium]